jgi:hypothetical protein
MVHNELFSIKPVPVDEALKSLRKEILAEVEKLIASRFANFRNNLDPSPKVRLDPSPPKGHTGIKA